MSKASTAPPTTQPVKEPAKTSPLRLGILFGVLVVALLMVAHYWLIARPATDLAYDQIDAKFKDQNAQGVKTENGKIDAGLLGPKDIQELLKKQPWSAEEHPDYMVEYYWWYGLPDRNYVAVKYVGKKGDWRFDTHYKNQKPPADDDNNDLNNSPPTQTPPNTGETGTSEKGERTPAPPGPPGPPGKEPDPSSDTPSDKSPDEKPATPSEESK